jgi:hypothetical protein
MLKDFVARERKESISIALPHSLWLLIDETVEKLKKEAPHLKINRSALCENALLKYFKDAKVR